MNYDQIDPSTTILKIKPAPQDFEVAERQHGKPDGAQSEANLYRVAQALALARAL